MNVLIVVPWDQTRGGVASVVGNLAKYLQARGHGVFFFHPVRKAVRVSEGKTQWGFRDFKLRLGLPFTHENPVLSTLAFFGLFPLTMLELIRLIRRHRIQVVNIHYPYPSFVYFAICRFLVPIKLVTSIHGADIFPKGRPREVYPATLRFLLKSSDLIVANSKAFQEDFLRLFPELRQKTTFIHNGVNLAELNGHGVEKPEKNGRYILCIATHVEKKGLDVLLRAFADIAAVERDLRLVLVGNGPLRAQLEGLAVSLQLNTQVQFVGNQGRQEVAKLLRGCEVFVLPSRSEPFGIVILEALACQKPVVATKTGGIPEIITNRHDGILVEPDNPRELADAILAVLGNQSLRKTIAENGYATVKKWFRWENTGGAYEEAFGHLMGSSSSPAYKSAL